VIAHLRRFIPAAAAAALIVLLAAPARADVDGGVPADAAVDGGVIDGAVLETLAPPPELAAPPDLSLPAPTAAMATPTVAGAPPPSEVEPPRPITRRLWFWLAVSGIIVAASVAVIAVQNPTTTRPDCPSGYVCPR
jgi:hypothetical protein